jgi:hypothetical protein
MITEAMKIKSMDELVKKLQELTKPSAVVIMDHKESDALASCDQQPEPIKEKIEAVDPLMLDKVMEQIKKVLAPEIKDNVGVYVENEFYIVTLMKSGLVKIITKGQVGVIV